MHNKFKFLIAIILIVFANQASAFRIGPFKLILQASGALSNDTILVENNTYETKAIVISTALRDIDNNGDEVRKDADEELIAFPSQMVLRPGQKQKVRVSYIGESEITDERAYRFIAEQVPLKVLEKLVDEDYQETANGSINIMLRYEAGVYVQPYGIAMRPELKLLGYDIDSANKMLNAKIENSGSAHIILDDKIVSIRDKNGLIENCESADSRISNTNLLPHKKITLHIPFEECQVDIKSVTISLKN